MPLKVVGNGETADIANLQVQVNQNTSDIENKIDSSEKAAINGVATLDATGKVPASQIEFTSESYKGSWNANTNTPIVSSGAGENGDYYIVSVAGSTTIDGVSVWEPGDTIIFNGGLSVWEKVLGTKTPLEILTIVEKTNNATGFSFAGGTTTSKTITVSEDVTLNQNLNTTSSPSFVDATLSGKSANTNEVMIFGAAGAISASGIVAATGSNALDLTKGTTTLSVDTSATIDQDISTTSSVTHNSITASSESGNDGELAKIGTAGIITGSGYSTNQSTNTTDSVTFNGVTISSLSGASSELSAVGASGVVESSGISYTAGVNQFTVSKGTTTLSLNSSATVDQDISTTSSVTHNSITASSESGNDGKLAKIGTAGIITSSGYSINQSLNTTDSPTFNTITASSESGNAGEVANISVGGGFTGSGYSINQNLNTTDSITFSTITASSESGNAGEVAKIGTAGIITSSGHSINQNLNTTDDVSFYEVNAGAVSGGEFSMASTAGAGTHSGGGGSFIRESSSSISSSLVYVYGGSDGYYPSSVGGLRVSNTNVKVDSLKTSGNDYVTSYGASDLVILSDSNGYLKSITLDNLLNERKYSYDSGWVAISTSQRVTATHNLGQQTLAAFLYFTPALTSNSVMSLVFNPVALTSISEDGGIFLELYDTNTAYVNTGNGYVFAVDNTVRYGGTQLDNKWTSGYARVILQKID